MKLNLGSPMLSTIEYFPGYSVNFVKFREKAEVAVSNNFVKFSEKAEVAISKQESISKIALIALKQVGVFFGCLIDATHQHIKHAHRSFMPMLYKRYHSVHLFAFEVAYWVFNLGCNIIKDSLQASWKKSGGQPLSLGSSYLKTYADPEINLKHIQTKHLHLDASSVPKEIQLDRLKTIFDEINFSDPTQPGYMPPSSRSHKGKILTVGELKGTEYSGGLETFIYRVKNREPFIGTPKAENKSELIAFHQHIEDAIRISIHKVEQEINLLKNQHPSLPHGNPSVMNKYKNLLENRARIALNLAFIGSYCGSRYMAETMVIYDLICRDGLQAEMTLKEIIFEALAQKRYQIAISHIQTYLGTDAHAFTNYMHCLGTILQLPGTSRVTEHIKNNFEYKKFVELFFKSYTVDEIIITIQDLFKSHNGGVIREKLIDWLKEQAEGWNSKEYDSKIESLKQEILEIAHSNEIQENDAFLSLECFQGILNEVKDSAELFKLAQDWDDFIYEFFSREEIKRKISANSKPITNISKIRYHLLSEQLGNELTASLSSRILARLPIKKEDWLPWLHLSQTINSIRAQTKINWDESFLRHVFQEKNLGKRNEMLTNMIKNNLDQERKREFLENLNLTRISQEGLSPELLELVLVSFDILNCQV